MSKKIGGELKRLRKTMGVNRADLAGMIGVSEDSVRGWERGQREPGKMARVMITGFILELGKADDSPA